RDEWRLAPVAAGLHRRAGSAVRLLRKRDHHGCQSAARRESARGRRRDTCRPERQLVPLRHPPPDAACHPSRCGRRREMSQGTDKTVAPRQLPGDLETNRRLDRWLRINRNGTVTVFPGKVEIGQGILTALAQIVAEDLDVAFERIRLAPTDTSYSPDEGITSGSRSVQEGGTALRHAAAEARQLLLDRAAAKLGVSLEQLTVADGVITARAGGSVTYWDLASDDLLAREASGDVPPKAAAQHMIVGAPVPRRDIPGKIRGTPSFVHDIELPGMMHGRAARPPSYGARLVALDEGEVQAMPGVMAVVRDGRFVGVITEREDQALRALNRIRRIARWEERATLPDTL